MPYTLDYAGSAVDSLAVVQILHIEKERRPKKHIAKLGTNRENHATELATIAIRTCANLTEVSAIKIETERGLHEKLISN